jgi:hypothetical protein
VVYEGAGDSRIFREKLPDLVSIRETLSIVAPFHTSSFMFKRNAFICPSFYFNVVSGDMALFSIIAASGDVGNVPGEMSVYRKSESGITNSVELKANYHEKRIELMQCLDQFHEYKFSDKAAKVIAYHRRQLNRSTIFGRLLNLVLYFFRRFQKSG